MGCAIGAQRGYQEILVCEQHSDQKKRRDSLSKTLPQDSLIGLFAGQAAPLI
jgi:hypothetical protein